MQLELKRKDDLAVSSWINDRPISTDDWEVYGYDKEKDSLIILLKEPNGANQIRIEIKKIHKPQPTISNKDENNKEDSK
jgi:hypothetical protein